MQKNHQKNVFFENLLIFEIFSSSATGLSLFQKTLKILENQFRGGFLREMGGI
jgi:hypothetical protein